MTDDYFNKIRCLSTVKFYYTLKSGLKQSLLVLLLVAGFTGGAIAQLGTVSAVPQVLSPEAAALGKFVEVPVSNYSGLPEIGIPIYSLKTKKVDVPVSLSYHASGVKVKDIPGWVGANWALNAGGMIVRIVRGIPDANLFDPDYYLKNVDHMGSPGYYWPDPRSMPGIASEAAYNKVDTEFDIFYYNFMGHTGRFTYNPDGQPVMLDVGDVKVTDGLFTLVDDQGVKYEFNTIAYSPQPNNYPYISTWYLDRVTIPDQDEEIRFNYKRYDNYWLYRYPNTPDSYLDRALYQDVFPPQGEVTNPACNAWGRMVTNDDLQQGDVCVLTSITYKGDSLKFYHDTTRADVYKLRLDSIRVFQGANVVQSTRFGYTINNSSSSDLKDKKLMLTSVQSNDQPAYLCDYYGAFNSQGMPGPYANASDYWGYYNGGSYDVSTPAGTPRNPDYRYGQIGSLHTLSYPTGGNTEFTYEGNTFSYSQNELDSVGPVYQAGGLRIKKIKFNSPLSSSSFEKSYEYTHGAKSSGVLEVPFANKTTFFYWGEGRFLYNPYCDSDSWPQVCSFIDTHHDNIIPLGNAQGGVIGYAQVIEYLGDGSKKVMQFTNGGFDPYTYYPLFDPLLDGYADGFNNDYLGDTVVQNRLAYDYSSFRGKLKYAAYYNSSGTKIKQEVHKFTDLISDRLSFSAQPKAKNFYAVINPVSIGWTTCTSYPPDYNTSWNSYWHFQRNFVPVLDSLYTFNGADTLKEVTKYEYNTPFHYQPSRVIKVGTRGDSTITHYQYPYDYTGIATDPFAAGVYTALISNVTGQPVETWVEKKDAGGGNARVTDAQLLRYHPSFPVLQTVYKLNNPAGLTDFTPSSWATNPSTIDSRYLPDLNFYRYDGKGNVTEQGKDSHTKEVLVWGYSHRFIVARVSSSDYATVIALVDSTVINNPSSDAAMRTELSKIRTGLAGTNVKAKVTTYTYATLKGLTSMTDPKGETTYYEYDDFGRLKRRKDHNSELKENLWYHYKP